MPLYHNRHPNPEMNNPPGKAERDARKMSREERGKERKIDRIEDRQVRDWTKQQRRKNER